MSLAQAPLGAELRVVSTDGDLALMRRLAELGLRPGRHVRCVQPTAGGGRVIDVAGARIALGAAVLAAITLEPATPEPTTPEPTTPEPTTPESISPEPVQR